MGRRSCGAPAVAVVDESADDEHDSGEFEGGVAMPVGTGALFDRARRQSTTSACDQIVEASSSNAAATRS